MMYISVPVYVGLEKTATMMIVQALDIHTVDVT